MGLTDSWQYTPAQGFQDLSEFIDPSIAPENAPIKASDPGIQWGAIGGFLLETTKAVLPAFMDTPGATGTGSDYAEKVAPLPVGFTNPNTGSISPMILIGGLLLVGAIIYALKD